MIEKFIMLVSMLAPAEYPLSFTSEQKEIADVILQEAQRLNEDPYILMSIAYQESRIQKGQTSHTGDVGIFQINWRFWGKRMWRYKSYAQFEKDMNNPSHATVAAVVVLKEMRLYKTCRGANLFACYNGGPAWIKSKNIDKLSSYARQVEKRRKRYKSKYPNWTEVSTK